MKVVCTAFFSTLCSTLFCKKIKNTDQTPLAEFGPVPRDLVTY